MSKKSKHKKASKYNITDIFPDLLNYEIVPHLLNREVTSLWLTCKELNSNIDYGKVNIFRNYKLYRKAPCKYKNDENITFMAVKNSCTMLRYASKKQRRNPSLIRRLVHHGVNECLFDDVSISLRKNKKFMKEMIKSSGYIFQFSSLKLRSDKEFVLYSSNSKGFCLEYASEDIKDDETIVRKAIETDGYNFIYISDRLKKRRDLVKIALSNCANILSFLSNEKELKKDKEILTICANDKTGRGILSNDLPDEMYDDEELMLKIVKHNGYSLNYMPKRFKNNKKFALAAVGSRPMSIKYVSKSLQDDEDVVLRAINNTKNLGECPLEFASSRIRGNEKIVLKAMSTRGLISNYHRHLFCLIPSKTIINIIKYTEKRNIIYLESIFQNAKEATMEALKITEQALKYSHFDVQDDVEVVSEALKHGNPGILKYASEQLRNSQKMKDLAEIYYLRKLYSNTEKKNKILK